ncbi:hypothetical protein FGG08_004569 [Glutinoglossum americanum]|uniref:BZIP domain-containing protein n=1 Tax=Glutinoglossum americanum TaxID=1670608 RepID=A0A9P8I4T4_9PEZI|nr:hypothetical protein FGG08_004569 [Glutinoglossum americanum]
MADPRQAYPPEYLFPSYSSRSTAQSGLAGRDSDTASWPLPSASSAMASISPLDSENASAGESSRTRSDGQEPKRRGPKPDSKPALTRRQELNRQAQRTHRERKELYIKALEQEVMRLRESFSTANRDKETYAEENRKLKELLRLHGISWPSNTFGGSDSNQYVASDFPGSASDRSGSYGMVSQGVSPLSGPASTYTPTGATAGQQPAMDYDSIGIDFVLTALTAPNRLERPCMDHMQMLILRSNEEECEISGHALMASCPPESHITNHPQVQWTTEDASNTPSLASLLDLSKRLHLDGEITPVMAWGLILGHPRFAELNDGDFEALKEELKGKIRCYGFGAVLEEFEVRDALNSVFATKQEVPSLLQTYHVV